MSLLGQSSVIQCAHTTIDATGDNSHSLELPAKLYIALDLLRGKSPQVDVIREM